ncbi:MAG: beta-ketoacyl synthase chain length factor [Bacteroidales bacterium]|nr:beta-ketoacyl synthase chain length factor [Bacteroidales bacterium]
MAVFIRATQSISPQNTFLAEKLPSALLYYTGRMTSVLPDFKNYYPAILLRRMNYVIKTGNACAIETVKAAQLEKPDAIIVGTGLGCVEDTEKFLNSMLERNEGLLTPTTFIQSIHNTVGGNIALHHKSNGYNLVYAHKTISFESALMDAFLLVKENDADVKNVLVGGVDEITPENFKIKADAHIFRYDVSNENILHDKAQGSVAGEGITFFMLNSSVSKDNFAEIVELDFTYRLANNEAVDAWILNFLERNNISANDIDVVFVGINGDKENDAVYEEFLSRNFATASHAMYKNMCGEYDTATSFAMWFSAHCIKEGIVPEYAFLKNAHRKPRKILIYNQDNNSNHSIILLSECSN